MGEEVKLIIIENAVVLKRTVSIKLIGDPNFKLVAAVNTIDEAVGKISYFKPDVVIMGVESVTAANMGKYEKFIKEVNLPTIIITNESAKFLNLIRSSKIEFVSRPPMGDLKLSEDTAANVILKLKRISNISTTNIGLASRVVPNLTNSANILSKNTSTALKAENSAGTLNREMRSVYTIQNGIISKPPVTNSRYGSLLIAVGASTGGTEALFAFLTKLPQDMPPMLITQHMPPVFTKLFAERLNLNCKMEVREAANGDTLYPGLVLVAPGDKQMCLTRRGGSLAVECVRTDKVSGHCPSVDVLFETVAAAMGNKAIGIIMTGMGRDGAKGMLQMHDKGAYTIGQDEESSVVYGMPRVAYELGGVDIQAPPEKIPDILQKALRDKINR